MTKRETGSRFLYEPFDAHSARLEVHERVTEERWTALERRLVAIEVLLDRQERRMWLAVWGIATFLAADAAYSFLSTQN